jgi:hypothetical protein
MKIIFAYFFICWKNHDEIIPPTLKITKAINAIPNNTAKMIKTSLVISICPWPRLLLNGKNEKK